MQVSTVLEIKNLTAEGYYSITGSRGLQLRVTKYGKEFYFRYSWKGKRQLFKIGTSDSVSLSDARKKAIELSELVRKGTNPKEQKTAGKEECTVEVNRKTFKECALDWVKERATNNFWKNNVKGEANTLSRLSNHVFPKIGEKAIESIEPEDIRDLLLPVWNRSPSTSSKVLADVRAILRWAIALRIRGNRENPADLSGALGVLMEPFNKNRKEEENFSGLDFHEIPEFVKDISSLRSRTAEMLLFSIFLAARSKPVRNAKWSDIDIEKKIWNVPPEDDKVKGSKRSRTIFLNEAAVTLLKNVIRFSESPYVFCNSYGRPYSDMAMNQLIRKAHARKNFWTESAGSTRKKQKEQDRSASLLSTQQLAAVLKLGQRMMYWGITNNSIKRP